eukprot:2283575-Amphidinium_carterae.1
MSALAQVPWSQCCEQQSLRLDADSSQNHRSVSAINVIHVCVSQDSIDCTRCNQCQPKRYAIVESDQ